MKKNNSGFGVVEWIIVIVLLIVLLLAFRKKIESIFSNLMVEIVTGNIRRMMI
jgi:Sec-independent protein translocase protein TatA